VFYDIEITDFTSGGRTSRTVVSTAEEAGTQARAAESIDQCLLLVGRHAENVSHDDFHLWLAGSRAFLRLDGHRDWYATDPGAAPAQDGTEVELSDLDGRFSVPFSRTLSRTQGFEALLHWLRTGEMMPGLAWR
jgi:hypothetical protein